MPYAWGFTIAQLIKKKKKKLLLLLLLWLCFQV